MINPFYDNSKLSIAFRSYVIELEERTFGAFHSIQQLAFDHKAELLAREQEEKEFRRHEIRPTMASTLSIITTTTPKTPKPRFEETIIVPTKYQIRALFHLWNHNLASGNADAMAKRYAKHATFFPMDMEFPLTDQCSIQEYYEDFLATAGAGGSAGGSGISCRIIEGHVTVDRKRGLWAQDNGVMEYILGTGETIRTKYTFFYVKDEEEYGKWKIVNHHSSKLNHRQAASATVKITQRTNSNSTLYKSPPHRRPSQVEKLVAILLRQESITETDWRNLDLHPTNY
jgi:hypothetical protein